MNEWLNHPALKNMDPVKLELIKLAAKQTEGKNGKSLAPVMMSLISSAHKKGITFYAYMVLEQGALSGKYDEAHPFPEESERGKVYNPIMPEIKKLTDVMGEIGAAHDASTAQIAIAWAMAKGTLPIVGVTKTSHVTDVVKAEKIKLTEKEIFCMENAA